MRNRINTRESLRSRKNVRQRYTSHFGGSLQAAKDVSQNSIRTVIGLHAAREVLKVRPKAITEIWLKVGAERSRDHIAFIEFAKKNLLKLQIKSGGQLDKIAPSHQGVCVLVNETPDYDFENLSNDPSEKIVLLALDEVTDPHNVGAVLRTAWLLGAKAILVPENRSAHLTPAVMKVASGGAEHVPLVNIGSLATCLTALKKKGFWIYGLDGSASSHLPKIHFNPKVVLVVGAEDKGLRSTTAAVCDELISIPQNTNEASFNASVAAALALYEVARQHQTP